MQVIHVFSAFGRITSVEGPQIFNVLAPAPGPGGPFPPVMHPAALVRARIHYASRDDAIMAWSTFSTLEPRIHSVRLPTACLLYLHALLHVQQHVQQLHEGKQDVLQRCGCLSEALLRDFYRPFRV